MAWQAAKERGYPVIIGIAVIAAVLMRMGSLDQREVNVAVTPSASKE
jgi:hypothetical protein